MQKVLVGAILPIMASQKKQKNTLTPALAPPSVLADLLQAHGFTGSPPPAAPLTSPISTTKDISADLSRSEKILLRREKKGRGGKTVTLVSGITLPPPQLEQLARNMRKGLGCGATIEHDIIVLQGDLQVRAQQWLLQHGARKVILAN